MIVTIIETNSLKITFQKKLNLTNSYSIFVLNWKNYKKKKKIQKLSLKYLLCDFFSTTRRDTNPDICSLFPQQISRQKMLHHSLTMIDCWRKRWISEYLSKLLSYNYLYITWVLVTVKKKKLTPIVNHDSGQLIIMKDIVDMKSHPFWFFFQI